MAYWEPRKKPYTFNIVNSRNWAVKYWCMSFDFKRMAPKKPKAKSITIFSFNTRFFLSLSPLADSHPANIDANGFILQTTKSICDAELLNFRMGTLLRGHDFICICHKIMRFKKNIIGEFPFVDEWNRIPSSQERYKYKNEWQNLHGYIWNNLFATRYEMVLFSFGTRVINEHRTAYQL